MDGKGTRTDKAKHVQTWLYRDRPREASALDVFEFMIDEGHNSRDVLIDALIALGEKYIDGYRAAPRPDDITIRQATLDSIRTLQDLAQRLAAMDFTTAPQAQLDDIRRDLSAAEQSLAGRYQGMRFDDE